MQDNYLFVVSTHTSLILVEVDKEWKLQNIDFLSHEHHYGIALLDSKGKQFIAKSGQQELVTYESSSDFGKKYTATGAVKFDTNFREVHQIAYNDGGIYVTNTFNNCLDYISMEGKILNRYYFNDKQIDINHVNSVFPLNDDTILCLLHNRGISDSEVVVLKKLNNGKFALINSAYLWDRGSHNIYTDGPRLIYNASYCGDFVVVDTNKKKVLKRIHFPGHTKGLSVLDKHYVVGYSDHAKREQRKKTRGYLAVIEKGSSMHIATIDLNQFDKSKPVGNINEVRCLSHHEYGHVLDEICTINLNQFELAKSSILSLISLKYRHIKVKLEQLFG